MNESAGDSVKRLSGAIRVLMCGLAILALTFGPANAQDDDSWAALVLEGRAALEGGDPAAALVLFEQAKDLAVTAKDRVVSLTSLGLAHAELGNLEVAARFHGQSLDLREEEFPAPSMAVATGLRNLAQVRHRQARLAETATLLARARAIIAELAPGSADLIDVESELAAVYVNMGRYGDAERLYRAILPSLEIGRPDKYASALSGLAAVEVALAEFDEAERLYRQAMAVTADNLGAGHPLMANLMNGLGEVYRMAGRPVDAAGLYRDALEIRIAAFGEAHPSLGSLYNNLGLALMDMGDLDGATDAFEVARSLTEGALGPNHPSMATVLANLADLDEARGDYLAAIEGNLKALSILRSELGERHPEVQMLQVNLARRLALVGDVDRAQEMLDRVEIAIVEDRGDHDRDMVAVLSARGQLSVCGVVTKQPSRPTNRPASSLRPRAALRPWTLPSCCRTVPAWRRLCAARKRRPNCLPEASPSAKRCSDPTVPTWRRFSTIMPLRCAASNVSTKPKPLRRGPWR